jgi:hypothetical protein
VGASRASVASGVAIEDLDGAYRLDPNGFTGAERALRTHAENEAEGGAWAKPPMP